MTCLIYSLIIVEYGARRSIPQTLQYNTEPHFGMQCFMCLIKNPCLDFAVKHPRMSDTWFHSSYQFLRRLCTLCTGHTLVDTATPVEAVGLERWWCSGLNQRRPNAICCWAAHSLGHFIFLTLVQGSKIILNTLHLKIFRALVELASAIQQNLLYRSSILSLYPTGLTIQKLICFATRFYVKSPYITRAFMLENSKLTCAFYRQYIHNCHINMNARSWSRILESSAALKCLLLFPPYINTRGTIIQGRALTRVHIPDSIFSAICLSSCQSAPTSFAC